MIFHLSALGRLIQLGEPKDAAGLRQCIETLCGEHIALHIPSQSDNSRWQLPEQQTTDLQARQITRTVADDWRVTSYSGLQQHGQSIAQDLMPKLDVDAAGTGSVPDEPVLDPSSISARRVHRAHFYTACLKSWISRNLSLRSGC